MNVHQIKLTDQEIYKLPSVQEATPIKLVVDANAHGIVVDEQKDSGKRHMEVTILAGGSLTWLTSLSAETWESERVFTLERSASLELYEYVWGQTSGHASIKEKLHVDLKGEGSSVLSQLLFFGQKKDVIQLDVVHEHHGLASRSHLIAKGAVKDAAQGKFFGKIIMRPGCSGADGKLDEHNLFLNKGARIEAVPALEIEHDEVQASHSAKMEHMDEEKLFYLQSRGVRETEAMELLVEGFYWDAIQRCHDAQFADQMYKSLLHSLR